jgi:hypothetical protein
VVALRAREDRADEAPALLEPASPHDPLTPTGIFHTARHGWIVASPADLRPPSLG